MSEIIASIVLIGSLFGAGTIVYRKADLINERTASCSFYSFLKNCLVKIKNLPLIRNLSFDLFLQKILSRIRVLTLKTDSKTSNWLQRLREKSCRKKVEEEDDYWSKVKDSTK
jgi:hypothetical protein